jgi:hypothetical protein
MWIVPSCQFRQTIPFSIDQGFLLGPRPSLDLPFSCNSIDNGFEMLGEHHRDWAPRHREAAMEASVVLVKPFVKALSRGANVVPAIGTAKNVQVCPGTHTLSHPLNTQSVQMADRMDTASTRTMRRAMKPHLSCLWPSFETAAERPPQDEVCK